MVVRRVFSFDKRSNVADAAPETSPTARAAGPSRNASSPRRFAASIVGRALSFGSSSSKRRESKATVAKEKKVDSAPQQLFKVSNVAGIDVAAAKGEAAGAERPPQEDIDDEEEDETIAYVFTASAAAELSEQLGMTLSAGDELTDPLLAALRVAFEVPAALPDDQFKSDLLADGLVDHKSAPSPRSPAAPPHIHQPDSYSSSEPPDTPLGNRGSRLEQSPTEVPELTPSADEVEAATKLQALQRGRNARKKRSFTGAATARATRLVSAGAAGAAGAASYAASAIAAGASSVSTAAASSCLSSSYGLSQKAAFLVDDYVDDAAKLVLGKTAVTDEEVNARTPKELWFRPSQDGWPQHVDATLYKKYSPAPALMPRLAELGREFYDPLRIGMLRLEVLECERLPNEIANLGTVDPYCVVLFERFIARTSTIKNDRDPRWSHHVARAFEFPVTCPYSTVYIAIMDDDNEVDDGLGRVVLELGAHRSGTEYDAWFPLQFCNTIKHVGKRGLVRLRVSVTFEQSRARLLSYLQPVPTFTVPFIDHDAKMNSEFAYQGGEETDAMALLPPKLKEHLAEMGSAIFAFLKKLEAFLFYKAPVLALTNCVLFQLVIVPHPEYLLACIPALVMVYMVAGLLTSTLKREALEEDKIPIRSKVPYAAIPAMAANVPEDPLTAEPVKAEMVFEVDEHMESEGDGDEDEPTDEPEKHASAGVLEAVPKAAVDPTRRLAFFLEGFDAKAAKAAKDAQSMLDPFEALRLVKRQLAHAFFQASGLGGPTNELELEKQRIRKLVDEEHEKQKNKLKMGTKKRTFSINPLAPLLLLFDAVLSGLLVYMRTLQRMVAWHDRILTLQLCVALALLTLVLVGVGYLLALIPWAEVFSWTFRLIGFAVFGPHMILVGRYVEEMRRDDKDALTKFAAGSREERARTLQEYRMAYEAKVMRKALEEGDAELKSAFEKSPEQYHHLSYQPNPTAGTLRYVHQADPTRSKAYPLNEPSGAGRAVKNDRGSTSTEMV